MNTLQKTEDGGLYWRVDGDAARVQIMRVAQDCGTVHLIIGLRENDARDIPSELLVYLPAAEAMAFSRAFRRAAIAALEHESD